MGIWQLTGWLLLLAVLVRFFPREFFPKFRQEANYQHLVLSSVVVLSLLWSVQAGIKEGLNIHFLLLTALVLSHGWRIAIFICLFPTALLVAFGKINIVDMGWYSLTSFILPGLFSYGCFLASYRYLQRHLFIYIFVAGFIAGALTIVLQLLLTSLWYYWGGYYDWHTIYNNYLMLAILVWFPEALLNGSAITLMAIYRPHWLRTFYDNEYLSPER